MTRWPVPRRVVVIAVLLVAAGVALVLLSKYSESSRGRDGLPDHRPVRAADLANRPEARLLYPGATTLTSARSDQSSDPNDPGSGPAKVEALLATQSTPAEVRAWYQQKLAAGGWREVESIAGDAPPGGAAFEWRRGSREYYDLTLYLDRAALGPAQYAVAGLIFRAAYLVVITR